VGDQLQAALISVVVSACVSIIVGGLTARATERRAAFNARKTAICQDIEDISLKCRHYWRTAGQNAGSEYEIMSLFDRLFMHMAAYFDHATSAARKPEFDLLMENFHEVATGGDFSSATRQTNLKLADDVRDKADALLSMFTDLQLEPKK
jgi:hypothetical protein